MSQKDSQAATKTGVENGQAKFVFKNGDEYDGRWKNYKMDGRGVYKYADSPSHKYDG
jgi:hypothetical protein